MFFTDQRINALTAEAYLPTVFDQAISSTALSLRLLGNGKTWAGRQRVVAVKLTNSGTATSFSGLDTFTAAELTTKQRMLFDLRGSRQPAAISGMEITVNDAPESQIVSIVEETLDETQTELADYIAGIMYGYGTGNNNKDFIGVGAIADDGTNVTTIGGLSRSTYPVLNGTLTSTSGTLSLDKVATLVSSVSAGSSQSTPTMAPTTEAVFDLYEQLLTPTVRESYSLTGRYNLPTAPDATGGMSREGLAGQSGFVSISYRGIPIIRDEKCPTGKLFMLNEQTMEWHGANAAKGTGYDPVAFNPSRTITGIYGEAPLKSFTGFNWSGWRTPLNQFGVVADILLLGNLIPKRPNRNGQLTSITTV